MNWGGNMKNNYDIIFILNGKELVRYDFENSYKGEAQATCELLAYENKVNNKFYNIQNNEHFRYFVEEFGAVEL